MVERSNLQAALKRVKRNKGSPGSDGMTVEELTPYLVSRWEKVARAAARRQLPAAAAQVARNARRWWKNASRSINAALPNSLYDAVPQLAR